LNVAIIGFAADSNRNRASGSGHSPPASGLSSAGLQLGGTLGIGTVIVALSVGPLSASFFRELRPS